MASFSYGGDPANDVIDRIRFMIGDTDIDNMYLSNEELTFIIDANLDSDRQSAENALKSIIAKVAKEVDYEIGPEKVFASQRLENFKKTLDTIVGSAGQLSISRSMVPDRPPIFHIGMNDNPPWTL